MQCETVAHPLFPSAVILPVVCIVPETTWRRPSLSAEAPQSPLARLNSSPYGKTEPLSSQPQILHTISKRHLHV